MSALAVGWPGASAAQPVLDAALLRRLPAAEARQGVAVDARHFYAVDNSRIAKYDKASGRKVAEWTGDPARFAHINACLAAGATLTCANSNYPNLPQTSWVEVFDPVRMRHLRTIELGRREGSLTWVDRHQGWWWALFANYDGKGGAPGRDHRQTVLVRFDDRWRRTATFRFPGTVLERFAPSSSSGGGFGDDGLLYVTGHDRGEIYALRVPAGGQVLEHVATIRAPIEGQAIAWDRSRERVLYGVTRTSRDVLSLRIPEVVEASGRRP